jgi:hypothetical protein
MIEFESRLKMQAIPLTTAGTKSLFLISTGLSLLKHPLANIWWAIHYLNALCLTLIQ